MYNDSFKLRYKTAEVAISETNTFFPTKPHNHREIEMLLVLNGKSEVRINGSLFEAEAGDLIFVNPLEVHSLIAYRQENYCHRCICFDVSLIADEQLIKKISYGELTFPVIISKTDKHNRILRENFQSLYSAVEQDSKLLKLEAVATINSMMVYFVKNNLLSQNSKAGNSTLFCDRVLKFIAENYSDDITSKQAAESLCFNQSYFCRNFKHNFGMSFSTYLNMYRISASKKLIENETENVSGIAFKCGFSNPDYFTKCFKKLIGLSPKAYKKSIEYGKQSR